MAGTTERNEIKAFPGGLNGQRSVSEDARAAEFERLYRESYDSVYGSVLFRLRDEEIARDITADAFLRAARFFDSFDSSKAKFSTWVNAIARNCIIDYHRKNKEHAPIESVPESTFATEADHAQAVADADLARRLLAVLDEDDREIVFMKFCEDSTNADIARRLNMNPSTVATRVQRALAKMRDAALTINPQ